MLQSISVSLTSHLNSRDDALVGARCTCTLRAPGLHRGARASSYAACPNPMSQKLKTSVERTDFVFSFSALFESARRSIDRKACAGLLLTSCCAACSGDRDLDRVGKGILDGSNNCV